MNGVVFGYNISIWEKEHPLTKKLEKYKTKQPGEKAKLYGDIKKVWRLRQKLRYADIVMDELNIKGNLKEQVFYLLRDINDLNFLCRNCSQEAIIIALCFFVKKSKDNKRDVTEYSICKNNGLTLKKYLTIVTNIAIYYQSKSPIRSVSHIYL